VLFKSCCKKFLVRNQAGQFINYYSAVNIDTENIWFYTFIYTSFFTYCYIQNLTNWWNDPHSRHNVELGWVEMRQLNFAVSRPMITESFASNLKVVAADNAIYHLSLSWSFPEILAMNVQSCSKTRTLLIVGKSKWANAVD